MTRTLTEYTSRFKPTSDQLEEQRKEALSREFRVLSMLSYGRSPEKIQEVLKISPSQYKRRVNQALHRFRSGENLPEEWKEVEGWAWDEIMRRNILGKVLASMGRPSAQGTT
jgi:hypothetical protein